MVAIGAFTFVLHSHLPYARLAGRWPHGEEWIHEAASETYIPLLRTLYDLKEQGIHFRLTLGLTPTLAEQLADADVLDHFAQYLDARIEAAQNDIAYFSAPQNVNGHLKALAEWYVRWYEGVKSTFHTRFNRDIIGAFRRLQDEGYVELIGSAGTHAYLPLLSRDSSINAQIQTGVSSFERLFGRRPKAFWLPECAYRPAYITESGQQRPGLETALARHGIQLFFGETHAITGGQPVGVAAGDVIGPYGYVKRRYVIPNSPVMHTPERQASPFSPYYVSESIAGPGATQHSGVAIIGRNPETGAQVWSATMGYPGDFDYREFHKRAGSSGMRYWRVTGVNVDLGEKDYYYPNWARFKIDQHAEHFAHLVVDLLRDHHRETGQHGLVASSYDTELFGHWWFEGVDWLGKVLEHLYVAKDVEMTTASGYLSQHPPGEVLHIPESSWGSNGTHFTWDNADTHWMWQPIHESEQRMERLVKRYPDTNEAERLTLNQAAREMLLLQSSDWPFLVTTGQAREYAIQRFNQHLERFDQLAAGLETGQIRRELAEEYWERDKLFHDIDYRWFAEA